MLEEATGVNSVIADVYFPALNLANPSVYLLWRDALADRFLTEAVRPEGEEAFPLTLVRDARLSLAATPLLPGLERSLTVASLPWFDLFVWSEAAVLVGVVLFERLPTLELEELLSLCTTVLLFVRLRAECGTERMYPLFDRLEITSRSDGGGESACTIATSGVDVSTLEGAGLSWTIGGGAGSSICSFGGSWTREANIAPLSTSSGLEASIDGVTASVVAIGDVGVSDGAEMLERIVVAEVSTT